MATPRPSVWDRAVAMLDDNVREELKQLQRHLQPGTHADEAQAVINTVEQQALKTRRWSFKFGGRTQKVRDHLDTVLKAVKAVQEVGPVLAQLEPVYTGIPWELLATKRERHGGVYASFCKMFSSAKICFRIHRHPEPPRSRSDLPCRVPRPACRCRALASAELAWSSFKITMCMESSHGPAAIRSMSQLVVKLVPGPESHSCDPLT